MCVCVCVWGGVEHSNNRKNWEKHFLIEEEIYNEIYKQI